MSITSDTYPIQEGRPHFIEHFSSLFDDLWQNSLSDFSLTHQEKPGVVQIECIPLTLDLINLLLKNPTEINQISPEAFELLVADRLSAMGMGVKQIGKTNSKDGGIDIIAWPQFNFAYPFLLAVQVKHSKIGRAVGSGTVRDLKGVLAAFR